MYPKRKRKLTLEGFCEEEEIEKRPNDDHLENAGEQLGI
jgi:hypothetical protein